MDKLYLLLGTIGAIVHGVSMPVLFIVFGDITNTFVGTAKYEPCNYTYTQCIDMGVIPADWTEA